MAKQYAVTGQVRTVNRLIKFLNRLGLGASNTYTLTTNGRKSGRPHSTPVTIAKVEGSRYLVAPYGEVGWVRNIRSNGSAALARRGQSREVSVTEVTEPTEAGTVLKRYFSDVKIVRPYFDADLDSGVDAFAAEADRHPVFRIES